MIRSALSNAGKCCSDFEITSEMVAEIGRTSIYRKADETGADETTEEDFDILVELDQTL